MEVGSSPLELPSCNSLATGSVHVGLAALAMAVAEEDASCTSCFHPLGLHLDQGPRPSWKACTPMAHGAGLGAGAGVNIYPAMVYVRDRRAYAYHCNSAFKLHSMFFWGRACARNP